MALFGAGLTAAQRVAVGGLALLAAAAGVVAGLGGFPSSDRQHPDPTTCNHGVTIQGATARTPYDQMALAIRDGINAAGQGWDAHVVASVGSVANLNTLRSPSATCTIAIAQLNVAVDAVLKAGRYSEDRSYDPHPDPAIPDLTTVAPLYDDAVHLITASPSDIGTFDDLCGTTVEIGAKGSGTEEVSHLLFNATGIEKRCGQRRMTYLYDQFPDALAALHSARAQAVIWSAAAPTTQITDAIRNGQPLRFVPLDAEFRALVQKNFNSVFSKLAAQVPLHFPWSRRFFDAATLTYEPTPTVTTIGIPNAVVSRSDADPALVRFVAALITDHGKLGKKFRAYLTAEGFPLATTPLGGTSVLANDAAFCLVPVQADAQRYYATHGVDLGTCGGG
jgi:TRAP transporter TAXI family solute receptor